jgi:pimeloyl-ACP methyl ester carboxylesterase
MSDRHAATPATIDEVTHHHADVNGTRLHYVRAGDSGSPILLIHGFPETWWAFHTLIPRLAGQHRVVAVDLRGFGDSAADAEQFDSVVAAEDLHQLIEHLDLGPVHLTGQDIAGATVARLAGAHAEEVLSLTAIEMGLPGFGLEALADVTHGGAWHIGALATPGVPEMLLTGREREFLDRFMFSPVTEVAGAVTEPDLDEFVRCYSRENGWQGAANLYRSMLTEGEQIQDLLRARPLTMPVLAVDTGDSPFTATTMNAVASQVTPARLDGVGHYVAMEAPQRLSAVLESFVSAIDR